MKFKLILFLLFPTIVSGQEYVSLISTTDSSDTWVDINSCTDFSCYYSYTNHYTIDSDTIIGGLQYFKFYKNTKYESGSAPSEWCDEDLSYFYSYHGAIRESAKKIFVIPSDSTDPSEYVAYDFNLMVGDTLPSPTGFPSENYPNVISSIDSVLIFDTYRKRFVVDSYRCVTEGIGASTGLFNPIELTSNCGNEMLCYMGYTVSDNFDSDCDINLSVDNYGYNQRPAQLVKIIDYLGREVEFKPNTPLIYIYSDGTVKKMFKVE